MEHFPLLAVEDEGRLHDPKLRENFIERVFTYRRWRDLLKRGRTRGGLVDFHTRNKLLVLSHSPKHYQAMGRVVAAGRDRPLEELYQVYQRLLVEALTLKTTRRKNANVLQHLMGYFKKQLSSGEKEELLELIELYRLEHLPLIVPVTLINHFVRKYGQPYLELQTYLHPHPVEMELRNHV
jgi:uncharacterized protein YbgA (DUF1722 family)